MATFLILLGAQDVLQSNPMDVGYSSHRPAVDALELQRAWSRCRWLCHTGRIGYSFPVVRARRRASVPCTRVTSSKNDILGATPLRDQYNKLAS